MCVQYQPPLVRLGYRTTPDENYRTYRKDRLLYASLAFSWIDLGPLAQETLSPPLLRNCPSVRKPCTFGEKHTTVLDLGNMQLQEVSLSVHRPRSFFFARHPTLSSARREISWFVEYPWNLPMIATLLNPGDSCRRFFEPSLPAKHSGNHSTNVPVSVIQKNGGTHALTLLLLPRYTNAFIGQ